MVAIYNISGAVLISYYDLSNQCTIGYTTSSADKDVEEPRLYPTAGGSIS